MKYLTKNTIAFIILSICCSFTLHKYYTSLSQIELNAETNRIEIATKYFTDDLVLSIEDATRNKITLGNGNNDLATVSTVENYFLNKISLIINDSITVPLSLLGYEDGFNDTWVYMESADIPVKVNKVKFRNESFFHFIDLQKHILRFKSKDFLSSEILSPDLTTAEFELP